MTLEEIIASSVPATFELPLNVGAGQSNDTCGYSSL
jgi:hypothetical protein